MIYDIILICVFLLLIFINYRRGAVRALGGILTALASYALATLLGKLLSVKIYEWWIQPNVEKAAADAAANIGSGAAQAVQGVPDWLSWMVKASGEDISGLIKGSANDIAGAVNAAVKPVAVGIITFFVTLILFFVFCILLRLLVLKPILGLFELPVLRTANRIGGALIGLIDAFLLVSMLAYLLRLLQPALEARFGWPDESTIYNSFIFYHFYSGNIFTAIGSWIGL